MNIDSEKVLEYVKLYRDSKCRVTKQMIAHRLWYNVNAQGVV